MKITKEGKSKIKARYNTKFDDFIKKTKEELKEIYKGKMSSTDRKALVDATQWILWKERQEALKEKDNNEVQTT